VTFTREMALFLLKCFSLRKVEKMLSFSELCCAMRQVGEKHRKELLCGVAVGLCECQGGREGVCGSLCGCVGANV